MTTESNIPKLPTRDPNSHKGDFGRTLLVGGSRGMAGAISLAGIAALRSGAGLVRLAVPIACQDVVASFEPSYTTFGLPADSEGRIELRAVDALTPLLPWATCLACGPGLGRSVELQEFVCRLYRECPTTAVFDADAINALAAAGTWHDDASATLSGPRILTPHVGEFRRMLGDEGKAATADELATAAQRLAAKHELVLVLKGHRTLVTDGHRCFHNTTGNPGMATGGTGDVLTGIIAALAGQGLAPMDAARLGVYLHGIAGDLAAEELGQTSMIARDLIHYLPSAFSHHRSIPS